MDDPTWLVTGYGWSRDTPPHQHPQLYLHDTQHGRTRTAALIEELDFIRGQDKHCVGWRPFSGWRQP
ncbi:MAG: hypothetical protein AAFX99_37385, partial [Myxococcota bacterium]